MHGVFIRPVWLQNEQLQLSSGPQTAKEKVSLDLIIRAEYKFADMPHPVYHWWMMLVLQVVLA